MKIKVQYETETYISEGGYYCIRQDHMGEESLVMLSPLQCRILARELSKAAKGSAWWQDIVSGPEDLSQDD